MTDTITPLESALASVDFDKLKAKFDAVDVDKFVELNDLWKPTQKGQQLLGMLIGKERSNFESDTGVVAHWWGFAALEPQTGRIVPKRVLGGVSIERALSTVEPGTMVQLTYEGEEKVAKGTVKKFTVRVQP